MNTLESSNQNTVKKRKGNTGKENEEEEECDIYPEDEYAPEHYDK